jgi:hypothetical protein
MNLFLITFLFLLPYNLYNEEVDVCDRYIYYNDIIYFV